MMARPSSYTKAKGNAMRHGVRMVVGLIVLSGVGVAEVWFAIWIFDNPMRYLVFTEGLLFVVLAMAVPLFLWLCWGTGGKVLHWFQRASFEKGASRKVTLGEYWEREILNG